MNTSTLDLDLSQLQSLTGDDQGFMIEILELILEQSPTVLASMHSQFEAGDFRSLGATAHKYKSSINILGNVPLIKLMQDIEEGTIRDEEPARLRALIQEFEQICDQLLRVLHTELTQLRT